MNVRLFLNRRMILQQIRFSTIHGHDRSPPSPARMARSHNTYLAYKRDTTLLLYWVIQTSNQVINSKNHEHGTSLKINTSGQTTVSGFLSMAELIAGSISGTLVPAAVYRLFQSVIKARTTTWQAFQKIESKKQDPDIEKSNSTHKFFIDALSQAFEVLGGKQWEAKQYGRRVDTRDDAEAEIKQSLFSNKFSKLDINEEQDESDCEDSPPAAQAAPNQQQRRKTAKNKKVKGKKKTKKQQKFESNKPDLEGVPVEGYRIIEDESGISSEYLMAVYALVQEWCDLRQYLSGLWMEVAYAGLNSATAGVISNMAVAMLERSEFAIFLEFPGHDTYETVMKTVMRGDPERKDPIFSWATWNLGPGGNNTRVAEVDVDMKELLLIHAYQDFMAFITDFHKNSNGKPSKALAKELGKWDPEFDLRKATKEERLKWRRAYTINWLYDLLNLFSAVVVQQNTLKGQNWDLTKVDWSVTGPWNRHRRLFGLNEFAGFVCSMAWQKKGTDISKHVMPHHILQLQVIVDSLTVSRGWSLSALEGHVIREPARQFRPRRDVDRFLDRENKSCGSGYLPAADVLKQVLQKAQGKSDDSGKAAGAEMVEMVLGGFRDWLGESKYMSGIDTIPPSRFSDTNSNGLWEYSPFLCGVGLMEGLEIAYRLGMFLWDRMFEPLLAVHLHNMLVQKGYITDPVGLYSSLQSIFQEAFFGQSDVPTSDFAAVLLNRIFERSDTLTTRSRVAQRREIARSDSTDIHAILDVRRNKFFTLKPNLILYREANWNTERIPERDITIGSVLGIMRLSQTKQLVDPETGKRRLEPTELVRRHLAETTHGRPAETEDSLIELVDGVEAASKGLRERQEAAQLVDRVRSQFPDGMCNASELRSRNQVAGGGAPLQVRGSELLEGVKLDIHADIAGNSPVSSLNYAWVTVRFMILFEKTEAELKKRRNTVYVRAFETDPAWKRLPRVGLVYMAMLDEDEECLRVMAREFQNLRSGFVNHVYWDIATELPERSKTERRAAPDSGCTVM